MKALKYILPLFAAAFLLSACEKEITVDLPQVEQKIVVEGYIFQGERPWVILSKNSGYFEPLDSAALINSFITDAVVTVTDGTLTDTLKFTLAPESPYGIAYVAGSPQIVGEAGKTYTLTVTAIGQTVTSTTSIIQPVTLDSTRWRPDVWDDSLGLVWFYWTDPGIDERGYRVFSRRVSADPERNEPYFRPNFEFWNRFSMGQWMSVGVDRAEQFGEGLTDNDEDDPDWGQYRVGDTVQVRLCVVDLPYFTFLNTLSSSLSSGGPFAAPNNVISNVNGGLGGWGGYGVTQFEIVCQP